MIRRFEIIGEAIRNLPEEYKAAHPEVPWQKAMAMRNILIHEYFGVDLKVVWDTAKTALSEFREQIKALPELEHAD